MSQFGDWRDNRPFTPVAKTREDLWRVLDQYRKWYDEGLSDSEISLRIRQRYIIPNNPQSQFRRGKR